MLEPGRQSSEHYFAVSEPLISFRGHDFPTVKRTAMPPGEPVINTRTLAEELRSLPPGLRRVLLIRSAPEKMLLEFLEILRGIQPEAGVTLLCHAGRGLEGCESLIYPHQGFFRPENVNTRKLKSAHFELAAVPYATERRFHPAYYNVDSIAQASGADRVVLFYRDGRALPADKEFFELKRLRVVEPYLERKRQALAEIAAFTGEELSLVEEKCDLAGLEAVRLWSAADPRSEEEVRRYYTSHDFYIYELMKTEYNGDREELVDSVLEECAPGEKVLDYGAGVGIFSIPLAARGAEVTHLDLPGPLFEFARSRFASRGLPVRLLACEREEPLTGSYDTIVSIFVVEHLLDPERTLRHLSRHITREGKLLLAVDFEEQRCGDEPLPLHLAPLTAERYYSFMRELGLELVRRRGRLDVFRRKA